MITLLIILGSLALWFRIGWGQAKRVAPLGYQRKLEYNKEHWPNTWRKYEQEYRHAAYLWAALAFILGPFGMLLLRGRSDFWMRTLIPEVYVEELTKENERLRKELGV